MSNFKIIDLLKQFRIKSVLKFLNWDATTILAEINSATERVTFPTMNFMNFKGGFVSGTQYYKNDVVRGSNVLSQALIDTETDPSIIAVGSSENGLDKSIPFTIGSNTSVVQMVHIYTSLKTGVVQLAEIHTPFWDLDSVTRVVVYNETSGEFIIVSNPFLNSGEWTQIPTSDMLVNSGDVLKVSFEYYNSDSANNISGGWDSNRGTGIPNNQEINLDNLTNPAVIEISHTDLDNVNRTTELDGVSIGSIIHVSETGDANRNFECEVSAVDLASATSTKYTVINVNNGGNDVRDNRTCSISIDVPVTINSEYSEIVDYYPANDPSFANVTTELYYDSVLQPVVGTDNAFGINIVFQEITAPTEWKIIHFLEGGSNTIKASATYKFTKVSNLLNIGDVYVPLAEVTESTMKNGSVYELKMSVRGTFTDVNDSMYIRYRIIEGVSTGTWNEFIHQSKSADDTWIFNYLFPRTSNGDALTIEMEIRKETGGQQLDVAFGNIMIDEKI